MTTFVGVSILFRLAMGVGGSIFAGWLVFRSRVWDPGLPSFQCVTVGFVFAAILSYVRASRFTPALFLPVAWAATQFGLWFDSGMPRVLSQPALSIAVGGGLFLVSVAFDAVAARGFPVGKFILVGPLVGALYMAVTPLAILGTASQERGFVDLWTNFGIGMLIGDGVGFGVEAADLVLRRFRPATPTA